MVLFATTIGRKCQQQVGRRSELTADWLITVSIRYLVLEAVHFSSLAPLRLEDSVKIRRKYAEEGWAAR